ncbi:hypothetical protein SUGI_0562780 [Cryptomeria japonica]|nr:hypothetical protein SUGI_0562780 [Cryptomeria japonica]
MVDLSNRGGRCIIGQRFASHNPLCKGKGIDLPFSPEINMNPNINIESDFGDNLPPLSYTLGMEINNDFLKGRDNIDDKSDLQKHLNQLEAKTNKLQDEIYENLRVQAFRIKAREQKSTRWAT